MNMSNENVEQPRRYFKFGGRLCYIDPSYYDELSKAQAERPCRVVYNSRVYYGDECLQIDEQMRTELHNAIRILKEKKASVVAPGEEGVVCHTHDVYIDKSVN